MGVPHTILDVHSHVLPGLDDGPRTLGRALRLCEVYVAEGVSTVVATPHLGDGVHAVTAAAIRRRVEQLTLACERRGLPLALLPGSEARVHPELLQAFDAGELLTVADNGRYLLLEFHLQRVPPIAGLLFELARRGVQPILCHPERHPDFWRRPELLAELVDQGCLVQVTAGSLLGAYGPPAQRTARRLLSAGLVHVVASDAHSARARPPRLRRAAEGLASFGGEGLARRLLETHPKRIIRGEPLEESPLAGPPPGARTHPLPSGSK
jgi:protein-tyrosine phosphatase